MVDDYIQVKHGRQEPEYKHPVMKEILEETHGVMVYQEQVMRILNRLGGIELANAYSCIKAISKKKLEMIAKFREEFIEGAHQQGMAKKEAAELFGLIEKFAGYGFNKSHTTAYALIAYMTAYLKAHWPVEFMAALLVERHSRPQFQAERLAGRAPRRLPAEGTSTVLPPDVNRSGADFTVADGKNLLRPVGHQGLRRRGRRGHRRQRARQRTLSQPLRFLRTARRRHGQPRGGRIAHQGRGLRFAGRPSGATVRRARSRVAGRLGRGLRSPQRPEEPLRRRRRRPARDRAEQSARRARVAGTRATGQGKGGARLLSFQPSAGRAPKTLAAYCSHTTTEAAALNHRAEVMLGGMLAAVKFAHTKNPKPGSPSRYAMFDLEDTEGVIRCIVWPEQFVHYEPLVQPDAVVVVRGVVDKRPGSEEANLIVNEIIPLEDLPSRCTRGILIRV